MEQYERHVNFDFGWKFLKHDITGPQNPHWDDTSWKDIDIPHDWSIEGPFDKNNPSERSGAFLPRGVAWYRKHFNIPKEYRDKIITIEFDGIYQNSEIWINGQYLGKRPYGYVPFIYDLTPYINFEEENILSVRIDNTHEPNSRWYPGSGIYRHVWLNVLNKQHVKSWGTYVTTPEINTDKAAVLVETQLNNYDSSNTKCILKTEVIDEKGNIVAQVVEEKKINANGQETFSHKCEILEPQLWSVESPVLYYINSTVTNSENEIVDIYTTPFGIRSIKFDKDKGFILNGKHMKIKGVNLHNDAGCLGSAVPEKVLERRLRILKSMGCNAIRTSHNPPARELLDMCDTMGFMVVDEAFDKWHSGYYGDIFENWWEKDLESMLLRDRNHPSIVMWSVGNEVENQGSDKMLETLGMLVDYVHKNESTRPVTYALVPELDGTVDEKVKTVLRIADKMDILSCNYHEPFYKLYREENPNVIILGSETYPFFRGTIENHKGFDPTNPWFDVVNNDYVIGQFIWAGIDYLGESEPWPSKGWSGGIIDTCGFKKSRAYFSESVWSDKPMVHVAVFDDRMEANPEKLHWNWPKIASHWTFPHFKNDMVKLVVFTNCHEVEIIINGFSWGTKSLSDFPDHMMTWYVPYEEGKIEAIGKKDGAIVSTHELCTSNGPDEIMLKAEKDLIEADNCDIVHVEVAVTDKNGTIFPYADNIIEYEIKGPGKILGIDNGDLCSNESYKSNKRKVYKGRGLVIIQSTKEEGDIELTAKSQGLKSQRLVIYSKK